jgi:hypothetical protein
MLIGLVNEMVFLLGKKKKRYEINDMVFLHMFTHQWNFVLFEFLRHSQSWYPIIKIAHVFIHIVCMMGVRSSLCVIAVS